MCSISTSWLPPVRLTCPVSVPPGRPFGSASTVSTLGPPTPKAPSIFLKPTNSPYPGLTQVGQKLTSQAECLLGGSIRDAVAVRPGRSGRTYCHPPARLSTSWLVYARQPVLGNGGHRLTPRSIAGEIRVRRRDVSTAAAIDRPQ